MKMTMTHYMELLATNQPWYLILFMAIPVILAETIAITKLAILFTRNLNRPLRTINKIAFILVGLYFTGMFIFLFINAVIPITTAGEWRGMTDILDVGLYLSGIVPPLGMALLDMNLIWKNKSAEQKLKNPCYLCGDFPRFLTRSDDIRNVRTNFRGRSESYDEKKEAVLLGSFFFT